MRRKSLRRYALSMILSISMTAAPVMTQAEELSSGVYEEILSEEIAVDQEESSAADFEGIFVEAAEESSGEEFTEEEPTEEEPTEEEPTEEELIEEGPAEEGFAEEEELTDSDSGDGLLGDGDEDDGEVRYILGRLMTDEELAEQYAPFTNLPEIDYTGTGVTINGGNAYDFPMVGDASLPTRYDSREYGYVTTAKDQGDYGICWAFGIASTMETWLLKNGYGEYDLSEDHLAISIGDRTTDPLGNSEDDENLVWGDGRDTGSNGWNAAVHLSTWSGMALESKYPLGRSWSTEEKRAAAYDTAVYLEDAIFSDYSIARTKSLIQQYGSVSITFAFSEDYYNANTAAYCYPTFGSNHAVTLVGWDDSYSRHNFLSASGVSYGGAWIAKNSWGNGWGDDGYFYISYFDQSIATLQAATATTSVDYPNNYFYDGTTGLYYGDVYAGDSIAIIYEAKASGGNAEVLGQIVLGSFTDGAVYDIQVYTNVMDPSNPTSGIPAYSSPIRYTQSNAGIDTVNVPEVLIPKNTLYSIVLTNAGRSEIQYMIECEYYTWEMDASPSILENQSFDKDEDDAEWTDAINWDRTYRIKGHTRSVTVSESYPVNMYRLYNPRTGEHLYTSDTVEVVYVRDTLGWIYEGIAWKAPGTGSMAIYRLYNPDPKYSEHHYTSDQNEVNVLVSQGWNNEGIKWYSDPDEGVPIYRLFNPDPNQPSAASHHYTRDVNERDVLVSRGWIYEGIGWYGVK